MFKAEIEENLKEFYNLNHKLTKTAALAEETLKTCLERYREHHLQTINEILAQSILHLKKVESIQSPKEILTLHTQFAHELNQQINAITDRFMQLALGNQASYNDWLKSHCDLSTD